MRRSTGFLSIVLLLTVVVLASVSDARASITYSLMNYPSAQSPYTVSGQITTDGQTGLLQFKDIQSASFTISGNDQIINVPNATWKVLDDVVYATTTELSIPMNNGSLALSGSNVTLPGGNATLTYIDFVGNYNYEGVVTYPSAEPDEIFSGSIGNNPMVIATATIPEPSALIIWSVLGSLAIGLEWWRKRTVA